MPARALHRRPHHRPPARAVSSVSQVAASLRGYLHCLRRLTARRRSRRCLQLDCSPLLHNSYIVL